MREPSVAHHLLHDMGIHAVESENDDAGFGLGYRREKERSESQSGEPTPGARGLDVHRTHSNRSRRGRHAAPRERPLGQGAFPSYAFRVAMSDSDVENLRRAISDPDIRSLFTPEFVLCTDLFDQYVTHIALRLLRELEVEPRLARGATVSEIMTELSFAPRAAIPLAWMLDKLSAEGFLETESLNGGRRFRANSPFPVTDAETFALRACAIDRRSEPGFAVVRTMTPHVADYFHGGRSGEDILFAPNRLTLWFDYFNNQNLLYAINNLLGAEAAVRLLESRGVEILELGGGSGSAALAFAERAARGGALDRVSRYRLTEIVPTFLRRAERALRSAFPDFATAYQRLDIDQPFADQGIASSSVDLVYAVNTIHVARDLGATLAYVRDALKPGGRLLVSECVRNFPGQPIHVEFIFNFLENFTRVKTDPLTRPVHGFLTPANWRACLTGAGFEEIEIMPEVERIARRYPSFFVAAIQARKPS
jgi:SAM-dependent methyltransferase